MYRKLKKYTRKIFISLFQNGPITTFERIFQKTNRIIKQRKERKEDQKRYQSWLKDNEITNARKKQVREEISKLKYKPLISIVMPVYNVDLRWIKKAIKSVEDQIYTNWELCIADDASTNPKLIKYLKSLEKNKKIKVVFRKKNGHISEASNSALKLATGEFVALMDNDDVIQPHALAEVVKVLNKKRDTDFIYSDEDKITTKGDRVEPTFKPDWSPELLLSTNYLSHLSVIRKKLVDSVGGFREGYEGSQDYDLFLRITEKTNNIEHVPDILYSWRKIPGSTAMTYGQKGYANKTSMKALKDAIKRRKLDATVEQGAKPGFFRVRYNK
jgi:glycosyltransferase involved in cell wall biosynthesis